MTTDLRILFMGTPRISADCLSYLHEKGLNIVGAVCQPDKPCGRGKKLRSPEVKLLAESLGIPVLQPTTLRDGAFCRELELLRPSLIVVVAYGKILPGYVLNYPEHGCINLHVSKLPLYRGAAPMQRAVMAGETQTGVTVMYMDEGMDTGDIIDICEYPILPDDDYGKVSENAAKHGAPLLFGAICAICDGTVCRTPQEHDLATYAPKIEKAECALDFSLDARTLWCKIRALSPEPLAVCRAPDGKLMKIARASVTDHTGMPGTVIDTSLSGDGRILLACGKGALALEQIQPEGKGKMTASAYLRGHRTEKGEVFG